ncbi:MAG TPA: hypothetical protein VFA27_04060 [Vicinamibacterales bacterium]|nr:hypothetical protein [Vicinamibacterales bacterium]
MADVLTVAEERRLLDVFAALPFAPYVMRGYEAKRRIVRYDAVPDFLQPVRDRVMARAALDAAPFTHALVTEYTAGAQYSIAPVAALRYSITFRTRT